MRTKEGQRARWVARFSPDVVLLLTAAAMISIWLVVAIGHLGDRYQLTHVSGEWIGLAHYARDGVLYPPTYAGGFYGGTRYGAVPIALHTLGYALTADPILSGKLLSAVGMALLLAGMALLVRRSGGGVGLSALTGAAMLATSYGWMAGVNIGADALATALQVLAILAAHAGITRGSAWRGPIVAALLCALAFFVKANAVAATLGIGAYYLLYDRRSLIRFLVAGTLSGLIALSIVSVCSAGRVLDNYREVLFAGRSAGSLLNPAALARSALVIIFGVAKFAPEIWALVPIGVLVVALCLARRRPSLVQVCATAAAPLATAVFTNPGIDFNHLLDLQALLLLVVAEAAAVAGAPATGEPGASKAGPAPLPGGLAVLGAASLLWLSVTTFWVSGRVGEARQVLVRWSGRVVASDASLDPASWRTEFRASDRVLSSDASIPVLMGQRPTVLNSFMLKVITDENRDARDALVRRLDAGEFDAIVSVVGLDEHWSNAKLREVEWGPAIADAIDRNYRLAGRFWGYAVYRPRSSPEAAPRAAGTSPGADGR